MKIIKLKNIPILRELFVLYDILKQIHNNYFIVSNYKKYGFRHSTSIVRTPCFFEPQNIYLHEQTRLSNRTRVISYGSKFIMKKYSIAATGLLVITGNHISTVGVQQFCLSENHINDVEKDMIVEEDVWMGANVTLLYGAHVGRGAICGAHTTVNKEIPPYAVVVGTPAKIIGVRFSLEQILEHESSLYREDERYTREYLNNLFEQFYVNKKIFGVSTMNDEDAKQLDKFRNKYDIKVYKE